MGSPSPVGKTSRLLKLILLFAGLVVLDQFSKGLISEPILNSGFFLGAFSQSSAFFRVFCTIAILVISCFLVLLVQFLTWKSLPGMSVALTFLEAGLVGNGIDKIRLGAVRDFVRVSVFNPPLVLNIADIELWIAVLGILVLIWKSPEKIWPKENLRNKFFVYPRSQGKIVAILLLIMTAVSFGNFMLFLAYLQSNGIPFELREVLVCFALFTFILLICAFVFGVIWSNRIYGPFRAIGRYLRTRNGPGAAAFKLRISDENECVHEIIDLIENPPK